MTIGQLGDIMIEDPKISKKNVEIECADNQFWIKDLGQSKARAFFNVPHLKYIQLRKGMVIYAGQSDKKFMQVDSVQYKSKKFRKDPLSDLDFTLDTRRVDSMPGEILHLKHREMKPFTYPKVQYRKGRIQFLIETSQNYQRFHYQSKGNSEILIQNEPMGNGKSF